MHILNYLVIYFNFRRELPVDLSEGNLKALSLQGLSQVLEKHPFHIYGLSRDSKINNAFYATYALVASKSGYSGFGSINHLKILQGVDMQLGMAIDNPKATLAVKRRLACEMLKCWKQVSFSDLMSRPYGCINLFFHIIVSLLFVH